MLPLPSSWSLRLGGVHRVLELETANLALQDRLDELQKAGASAAAPPPSQPVAASTTAAAPRSVHGALLCPRAPPVCACVLLCRLAATTIWGHGRGAVQPGH